MWGEVMSDFCVVMSVHVFCDVCEGGSGDGVGYLSAWQSTSGYNLMHTYEI